MTLKYTIIPISLNKVNKAKDTVGITRFSLKTEYGIYFLAE